MSKYLSVKYLLLSKDWNLRLSRLVFGRSFGGWYLQTMSKYLSVKYVLISRKTGTLGLAVQKTDFWGSI